MRIKKVNCSQFAGVRLGEKNFNEGLNVVVGNNESGKSTLTEFIYHALFTPTALDARSSGDFFDRCFPKKADASTANIIGGTIEIEDNGEDYKIEKTWGDKDNKEARRCLFTSPKELTDGARAEEEIRNLLKDGAGVYRDTVFSSQRSIANIIEMLLNDAYDIPSDVMADFSKVLANAALETKGIPTHKLSEAIEGKHKSYWANWDFKKNEPKEKRGNTKDGLVVQLYDSLKSLKTEKENAEQAEEKVKSIKEELERERSEEAKAKASIDAYNVNAELIKERESYANRLEEIKRQLNEEEDALKSWPEYKEKLIKAVDLEEKLRDAKILEQYREIKKLKDELQQEEDALGKLKEIEEDDISTLKEFSDAIDTEKKKLIGMNISIDIAKLDEKAVDFSYLDGEKIDVKANSSIDVNKPVEISIPGTLEMQIRPADADPKEVKRNIEKYNREIERKCKEFDCESIVAVEDRKRQYEKQIRRVADIKENYDRALTRCGLSWAALEEMERTVSHRLEADAVMVHLKELGVENTEDLRDKKASWGLKVEQYEKAYTSIEDLRSSINRLKDEKKELDEKIAATVIPDNLKDINIGELEDKREEHRDRIEKIRTIELFNAKTAIAEKDPLATYLSEIEAKEKELEKAKREGARWDGIRERFKAVTEKASKMDVSTLSENFTKYITHLSAGDVVVKDFNGNIKSSIVSGENKLLHNILSDGTKETIELAFRLAMLDEVFPEGGGFAIFDDPLANMDPGRTVKACELLKEFAKKNQVIFMTCDPKYLDLLDAKANEKIEMP